MCKEQATEGIEKLIDDKKVIDRRRCSKIESFIFAKLL